MPKFRQWCIRFAKNIKPRLSDFGNFKAGIDEIEAYSLSNPPARPRLQYERYRQKIDKLSPRNRPHLVFMVICFVFSSGRVAA